MDSSREIITDMARDLGYGEIAPEVARDVERIVADQHIDSILDHQVEEKP